MTNLKKAGLMNLNYVKNDGFVFMDYIFLKILQYQQIFKILHKHINPNIKAFHKKDIGFALHATCYL